MQLDKIRKKSQIISSLIAQLEIDEEIKTKSPDDFMRLSQGCQKLKDFLKNLSAPFDEERIREVGHDLRNLLGGINGYAELIDEDHPIESSVHAITQDIIKFVGQALKFVMPVKEKGQKGVEVVVGMNPPTKESDNLHGNILVVDDDENNRILLKRYLTNLGHSVTTAESAKAALQEMERESFDLVLLDLVMPDINGFQLLQELKSSETLRRVPVIMVSGVDDTEGVINCIKAGAEDYLTKPFNPILLEARLTASLERKRWHDREVAILKELEKRNQFIRQIFGRYLTNEIVDSLLEDPDGLKLGGASKNVTIVMSDIRGFSSICEKLSAEDVMKLLNNYLGVMTDIITKYQGILDEIIGDALLILFGAPIEREGDVDRAIACAIEMQRAMEKVNMKNVADDLPEISMGIGINTGQVIAGNIGSHQRSKYAVVGHNVNVTSRIESLTIGGQILASQSTIDSAKAPLDVGDPTPVKMKGVSGSANVYDIYSIDGKYKLEIPDKK